MLELLPYGIAIVLLMAFIAYVSRKRRKTGNPDWGNIHLGEKKFQHGRGEYGQSNVLRKVSLEEQIIKRHKQVPPKFGTESFDVILLDANVILGAVGFNGTANEKTLEFVSNNKDRVKMCRTVKSEVDLLMADRGTEEMYQRLAVFEEVEVVEPPHAKELADLEARQRKEIDSLSEVAITWLWEKRHAVKDILGQFPPVTAPPDTQRKALEKIYSDAKKDRIIAAKATALAKESKVLLVTNDQDIILFEENVTYSEPSFAEPSQVGLSGE